MELPKSSMVTSIQTQTYLERYEHIKAVEYSKDSLIEVRLDIYVFIKFELW